MKFYDFPSYDSLPKRRQPYQPRPRSRGAHYGLSDDDIARMLDEQWGGCAICATPIRSGFDIDHDHTTGKVRGLVCRRCNVVVLPGAESEYISDALTYLKRNR